MNTRRSGRDEIDSQEHRNAESAIVVAGTFRTAESGFVDSPEPTPCPTPMKGCHSSGAVFGGTILSVVALVAITLYNSLSNTITELRAEVSRLNDARAEMVKKEEFNTRTQNLWDRMQQLQEMRVTVSGLKEQVSAIGDKTAQIKSVQDQLTAIEQRLKTGEDDHKTLARAELTIGALEQKTVARDAQLKSMDDERKDLVKQLQELRERLAKVEGATETKPMPKTPASQVGALAQLANSLCMAAIVAEFARIQPLPTFEDLNSGEFNCESRSELRSAISLRPQPLLLSQLACAGYDCLHGPSLKAFLTFVTIAWRSAPVVWVRNHDSARARA